ncbi:hypothetical protein RCL1_008015 [Eukaryota sp. TZLM3-RCL]
MQYSSDYLAAIAALFQAKPLEELASEALIHNRKRRSGLLTSSPSITTHSLPPLSFSSNSTLFVDKFSPTQPSHLCMSHQKYRQLLSVLSSKSWRILLISGPPGAGKSTAFKLAIDELQISCCSYNEETLTLNYFEGQYQSPITTFFQWISDRQSNLIVIDNLPFLTDDYVVPFFQLISTLPNRIIIIDSLIDDRFVSRLSSFVEKSTVDHFKFLPATVKSIERVLSRVIKVQSIKIDQSRLSFIVDDCRGDVRFALNSLQLFCISKGGHKSKILNKNLENASQNFVLERGNSLDLFSVLRKIIAAKRSNLIDVSRGVSSSVDESNHDLAQLEINLSKILSQYSGDMTSLFLFFFENFQSFLIDFDDIIVVNNMISKVDWFDFSIKFDDVHYYLSFLTYMLVKKENFGGKFSFTKPLFLSRNFQQKECYDLAKLPALD